MKSIAGLRGDEVVDEVGGRDETDAVTAETGELANGVGEVGLADARRADENAVGLIGDELQSGGALDDIAVNRFGIIEVIGVEGRQRKNRRAL